MKNQRCGNCRHLDKTSETDIGGMRIARCAHPAGVVIGTTEIKNDFVELDAQCKQHAPRLRFGGKHA
ncbi:hypothetical protein [Ferriphaselus sp. R-1]|uniref:hypothetical protein n=1 Tax=Ferriphaselus sp. R-1 TaxID=1485544 RepID=UPI000552DB08|nr:hypothetical protein [Ferriphaselus sp. R-1]